MQQLIGRITNNAKVNHLKDGREVTNFSIALNDSYKPKGSDEVKKVVTYVDCAYWLSSKIATYLTKGSLVELVGRIGVKVYQSSQHEAKASLTFHVHNITLHGKGNSTEQPKKQKEAESPKDDLPF